MRSWGRFIEVCAVHAALVVSAALTAALPAVRAGAGDVQMAALPAPTNISKYEYVWLATPEHIEDGAAQLLDFGGALHRAVIEPYSLRADGFRLLEQQPDGSFNAVTPPPVATYRGWLDEIPGSVVAVSATPTGWRGVALLTDPGTGMLEVWGVQPLSDSLGKAAEPVRDADGRIAHVVYRGNDALHDSVAHCGVSDRNTGAPVGGIADGGIASSGLRIADVAFDTDAEYLDQLGNDSNATLIDIETVMNGVAAIYEAQLSITYEITYVILRPFGDPYDTSVPNSMLNLLRTQWNAMFFSVRRDMVHLMTGHALDGSVIGIANIGYVCDTLNAYGLSKTRYSSNMTNRVALTAHELGHNWNAKHCNEDPFHDADCRIMCASICGSSCTGCTTFASRALTTIGAFRDGLPLSCVPQLAAPLPPPFVDTFPDGLLDSTKWTYNNNAAVIGGLMNAPSPSNAMLLNASGPDDYADDEVRSNFILLGGAGATVLSYFTEHQFVEAGEQLVVEYYATDRLWKELNRITSDGIDQTQFTFFAHSLPSDALHNKFRVRFRVAADENNDQWFVDDVRVAAPGGIAVDAAPQAVNIVVSPSDANGAGDGLTPFSRSYPVGVNVTLTAPLTAGSLVFMRWEVDGVNQPNRQNVLTLAAPTSGALRARYAILGDLNGDGRFDNFDIDPFVLALVNRPVFESWYPGVDADIAGDLDGSGTLTNFDIEPFVDAIVHLP